MKKMKVHSNGQWELAKYTTNFDPDHEDNRGWKILHHPWGANQFNSEKQFLPVPKDLEVNEKPIDSKKLDFTHKDGSKQELYHHVLQEEGTNKLRHLLSEHKDPSKEGISVIHGETRHNDDKGHHLSLTGMQTGEKGWSYHPEGFQGKGYGGALLNSVIDYHKAVEGDHEHSKGGEAVMLNYGNKLDKDKYDFHPGIPNTKKDKKNKDGAIPHRMWFTRKDRAIDKKDSLGLVKPAKFGWDD